MHPVNDYYIQDGYLFKENKLCIPVLSFQQEIIQELHAGGLTGHLGREKIIAQVQSRFHWPNLCWDVTKFMQRCSICQSYKCTTQNSRLYMALPISESFWEDVSIDFITGLPKTK